MTDGVRPTPPIDENGVLDVAAWSPPRLSFLTRNRPVTCVFLGLATAFLIQTAGHMAGVPLDNPHLTNALNLSGPPVVAPLVNFMSGYAGAAAVLAYVGLRHLRTSEYRSRRMRVHADRLVEKDAALRPGTIAGDRDSPAAPKAQPHRLTRAATRESNRIRRLASAALSERDSPLTAIRHRGVEVALY